MNAQQPSPPRSDAALPLQVLRRLVLVRPGEAAPMLWSAAYFFCVLSGYYVLRPVREAMGIARGWDDLPWLMTGTLAAMLVANPLFAALVSRLPRRRFIPLTYRFFIANLLAFFVLLSVVPEGSRVALGYAFYIWLSVFNLFALSVFWAFMADVFTKEQSKRLFGFIGVGGTFGAIAGAWFTGRFVDDLGIPALMLVSAALLEAAVQCMRRVASSSGVAAETATARPARTTAEPGRGILRGLSLIARSPYLLAISAYMLLFTVLSTFLYMEQARIIEAAYPDREARTEAFANIDLWTNVATLLTQAFLTARIIRAIGVGGALSLLPLLTIVGFGGLWAWPTLGVLTVFQVLRRAIHYAVDRPARETLFTVLGPDAKYKSKSFIDTFVYRAGDQIGAWTPRLLAQHTPFPLAAVAIPLATLSIGLAAALGWMQSRRPDPSPGTPG